MATSNDGRRQSPTGACVRCRDKKLKCDSRRPRCGTCVSAKADCEPAAPQVRRGPKKGYLKTLQDQVARLEQQLAEAHGSNGSGDQVLKPPPTLLSPLLTDLDSLPMDLEPATSCPDFVNEELCPPLDSLITPPADLGLAQSLQGAEWPSMDSSPELLMGSLSAGTVSTGPLPLTGPDDGFDCVEGMVQLSTLPGKCSVSRLLQTDLLVSFFVFLAGAQMADGTR